MNRKATQNAGSWLLHFGQRVTGLRKVDLRAEVCRVRALLKEEPAECWRRVEERADQAPAGSIEHQIMKLLSDSGGVGELERIEQQLSSWMELPGPPLVITSSTPNNEVAALVVA